MQQKIRLIVIEIKAVWKRFCKDLKEHATRTTTTTTIIIIKEMIPLTHNENKSYKKQKVCYNAKKDLVLMITIKNIIKLEIIVIILENIEGLPIIFCYLRYETRKEIPVVF